MAENIESTIRHGVELTEFDIEYTYGTKHYIIDTDELVAYEFVGAMLEPVYQVSRTWLDAVL